ncbi:hypothetical protein ACFXPX_16625 [Kitasatospora sp. NPDC059146]|uniref:hypothetical protein n=1 Tax=Kitasatospora sp. NPDC059146 TaxID=3346741 RepID=UPI0036C1C766
MAFEECPHAVLAAQPVGAWSAEVFHRVVGALREQLAVEGLTRPHWWTRDHAAATPPGRWNRATLVRRPARYDDLATDSTAVFDGLTARGRLLESAATGAMTLTEDGEAARLRARDRNHRVHRVHLRAHQDVDEADVVTTINVLRRTTADMGGEGDLPDRPARPGPDRPARPDRPTGPARPGPARHGPARPGTARHGPTGPADRPGAARTGGRRGWPPVRAPDSGKDRTTARLLIYCRIRPGERRRIHRRERIAVGTAAAALLALGGGRAFADTSWGGTAPADTAAPADTSRGRAAPADTSWGGAAPADTSRGMAAGAGG